ncbi:ArsR/SmtB family transcription factor [Isoptericola sp. NPDC055881]
MATSHDGVLDALGDPTRRAVVRRLAAGPASVALLAADLPVSRPAVSQHLRVLHAAGLVAFDTVGTRHVYRLEPSGFEVLRGWLDGFWSEVLGAFAAHADARGGHGAAAAGGTGPRGAGEGVS